MRGWLRWFMGIVDILKRSNRHLDLVVLQIAGLRGVFQPTIMENKLRGKGPQKKEKLGTNYISGA